MNKFNEDVLQDLTKIFVGSEEERELFLSDMISEINQEIKKENDHGMIYINLDLETGECVLNIKGKENLLNTILGFSNFINIVCLKSFEQIDAIDKNSLLDLSKDTPLEETMNEILNNEVESQALLNIIKNEYRDLVIKQLTHGFEEGMKGKSINGKAESRDDV